MTATSVQLAPAAPVRAREDAAAVTAALTAFALYAFGTVPLVLGVAAQLGLTPEQTAGWLTVVWLTGAASTLALTLRHRQPLQIVWSIPGVIFLGAAADGLSYAQLVGVNLVAGVILLTLAVAGIGERLVRWLPLPIVLGSFAGSMLTYVFDAVDSAAHDVAIGGAALAGYGAGRLAPALRVPPIALAALAGGAAAAAAGRLGIHGGTWAPPVLSVPAPELSAVGVVTLSIPLAALSLVFGTTRGLGYLQAEGYDVPIRPVSLAVGLTSVVNAVLGGHQTQVSPAGTAIVGGPTAGPRERRYRASAIAGALMLVLALGGGSAAALAGAVPAALVAVVVGLAALSVLEATIGKTVRGPFRLGGAAALVVAALPFTALGMSAAVWAIPAGLAVSAALERAELVAAVRRGVTV
jgi:benzoate membrane transport protein